MTEAEWLACTDPFSMLEHLQGRASDRKLRLFACACCRRIQHRLGIRTAATATEVSERFADGAANKIDLRKAFDSSLGSRNGLNGSAALDDAMKAATLAAIQGARRAANSTRVAFRETARIKEKFAQVELLRDIFGTPIRRAETEPAWVYWNDGTVVKLAQAIYEDRCLPEGTLDRARVIVLANALEEAGCTDAAILGHCRGPGPHVRGCWAIDLLLGKE